MKKNNFEEKIEESSSYLLVVILGIVKHNIFSCGKSNVFIITYSIIGKDTINTIPKHIIAFLKPISFLIIRYIRTGTTKSGKKKYDVPYAYAHSPNTTKLK